MQSFHDDGELMVADVATSTALDLDLEIVRIEDVVARVPYGALKMNLGSTRAV